MTASMPGGMAWPSARNSGGYSKNLVEHMPNPGLVDGGLFSAPLQPVFVGFAKLGGFGGIALIQTLRKHSQEDGHGQERARGLHERKPFGVMASNAHRGASC